MHDRVHGAVALDEVGDEGGRAGLVAHVESVGFAVLAESGEQLGRRLGAMGDRRRAPPSAASFRAMAEPIPPVPPVTTAMREGRGESGSQKSVQCP